MLANDVTIERKFVVGSLTPDATTMCEAFLGTAERYADEVALRTPDGSVEVTFGEYRRRVELIAAGLAAAGIGRGDTVALLMANRPGFHICDTAALMLGAILMAILHPITSFGSR